MSSEECTVCILIFYNFKSYLIYLHFHYNPFHSIAWAHCLPHSKHKYIGISLELNCDCWKCFLLLDNRKSYLNFHVSFVLRFSVWNVMAMADTFVVCGSGELRQHQTRYANIIFSSVRSSSFIIFISRNHPFMWFVRQ